MFGKKKIIKNPISVIRKPEEINKEYSEKIFQLGKFQAEIKTLEEISDQHETRRGQIQEQSEKIFDRIKELSDEMTEAQKEKARKEDQSKAQQAISEVKS